MTMERKTVILCIGLIALISSADAATDARTSTNSYLISYNTISSDARTISENYVSTPDLILKSEGQVDGNVVMDSPSTSIIKQGLSFTGIRNGGLGSKASFSSAVVAENVISAQSTMTGYAQTIITTPTDFSIANTESFGMALANPGTDDYQLSVTGTQNTKTNAVLQPLNDRASIIRNFKVEFDLYPLEMDTPADLLVQNVDVNYNVENNEITGLAYDFSRQLEIGDISFVSEMNLVQL